MDAFPQHPALERFTGFLLRKVSHASFEQFAAIVEKHGLHPMHFGMLNILDADSPISQHELGQRIGVDPSTMVARMDVLEAQGLIERRRSNEDRRAYEIALTSAGRRKLKTLRAKAREHSEHFFRALTAPERKQLHALLAKLSAAVDADQAQGSRPRARADT